MVPDTADVFNLHGGGGGGKSTVTGHLLPSYTCPLIRVEVVHGARAELNSLLKTVLNN